MDRYTTRAAPSAALPGDAPPVPWDPNEYGALVCRTCGRPRVFRRARVNHSRQFMLAIGTLGLWLPVWGIIILLQLREPWSCTVCNSRQRRN